MAVAALNAETLSLLRMAAGATDHPDPTLLDVATSHVLSIRALVNELGLLRGQKAVFSTATPGTGGTAPPESVVPQAMASLQGLGWSQLSAANREVVRLLCYEIAELYKRLDAEGGHPIADADLVPGGTEAGANLIVTLLDGTVQPFTYALKSLATIAGFDISSHGARHLTDGADEVDGDKLDIDWNPTNSTPSTAPAEADSVDNLTAHLKGFDVLVGKLRKRIISYEHWAPAVDDEYEFGPVPANGTISQLYSVVEGGTSIQYRIWRCMKATPWTHGTEITDGTQTATTTGAADTMASTAIVAEDGLRLKVIAVTGPVNKFRVTIAYDVNKT